MANAKRASMREGPLAALFRKTEGEEQNRTTDNRIHNFDKCSKQENTCASH